MKPIGELHPAEGWQSSPYRVLAHGCDTYAETWNVEFSREARQAIEAAKAEAVAGDIRQRDGAALTLAGEEWRVLPHGAKGGVVHVLASPTMLLMCRAWVTEWCLTVRYLSAGLWEHGLKALRERADRFVRAVAGVLDTPDNPRITRYDYAVDIHAPGFAPGYAMADDWVFPQGSAKMRAVGTLTAIGRQRAVQTFTLGKITGLQVQLYDKVAEIREASGKDWFPLIWGGVREHVWRVESRFSGGWLKERAVRTFEDVDAALPQLLATSLTGYRLTTGDATRARRAAVHPLWWRAIQAVADASHTLASVNLSTMRREEFRALMVRNIAGSIRAAVVAHDRDATAQLIEELTSEAVAMERDDKHRRKKTAKLQERHRWIEAPA